MLRTIPIRGKTNGLGRIEPLLKPSIRSGLRE